MNAYRVFKKGSYGFNPFVIDNKTLENTQEVTLLDYGSKKDLSCGIFKMKNNSFKLTYPNDEVMLILDGEVILEISEISNVPLDELNSMMDILREKGLINIIIRS